MASIRRISSQRISSRRPSCRSPRAERLRRGMTLIEVVVALMIISTSMIMIAAYMSKFAQTIIGSDVKATAEDIAATQLENAKTAPRYSALDTLYAGTVALPSPYTGYTRQTIVTHTGGGASDLYDYKTITVIVTNNRLPTPVKKTDIIAAF